MHLYETLIYIFGADCITIYDWVFCIMIIFIFIGLNEFLDLGTANDISHKIGWLLVGIGHALVLMGGIHIFPIYALIFRLLVYGSVLFISALNIHMFYFTMSMQMRRRERKMEIRRMEKEIEELYKKIK